MARRRRYDPGVPAMLPRKCPVCGVYKEDDALLAAHMDKAHRLPYGVAHLTLEAYCGEEPDVILCTDVSTLTIEEMALVHANGGKYYNGLIERESSPEDCRDFSLELEAEGTVAVHFADTRPESQQDIEQAKETVEQLRARMMLYLDDVIVRLAKLREKLEHKQFEVDLIDDGR